MPFESTREEYRDRFTCGFDQARSIFDPCLSNALEKLGSNKAMDDFLQGANLLCMMGQGVEPVLVYLEEAPDTAALVGEAMIDELAYYAYKLATSTNAPAVVPFLQSMLPVARRLECGEAMQGFLDLGLEVMRETTPSIHGHHAIHPSPALDRFFETAPRVLALLNLAGLTNWARFGARVHASDPDALKAYFSLESADSRSVLQRECHGTLLTDNERRLGYYLQALWGDDEPLVPYPTFEAEIPQRPYFDEHGLRVPDLFDDRGDIPGIDRYRALLAHMMAHRQWSETIVADNYSPMQRLAMEVFEDARVEYLAMARYPGLRRLFRALHPRVAEGDCDPARQSCVNHRLMMLSRALLDPGGHGYADAVIDAFAARFHERMARGETGTRDAVALGMAFMARSRRPSDSFAEVWFPPERVEFRDDNRHLWRFIEEGDEEELFDRHAARAEDDEPGRDYALPPRLYPEWDVEARLYRPDWVSVFDSLHPSGRAAHVDGLLEKHQGLVKQLRQVADLLKPQNRERIRYQEEGGELDLDVAIRAMIDRRSGVEPDPRVNMSHRPAERDISVSLLVDLSASIAERPEGSSQTILELSQTAVSLLGQAVEALGDPFAIAGFDSNTRHEVRYRHIKGFDEPWGTEVKARLAGMEAGMSTRMGAALRHAGHFLSHRRSDKKLLLVLTDGEPHDVDVRDPRRLIADAREAVKSLDADGIFTWCISLDPRADEYVADIFGQHYTVVDRVERLPEALPRLFMQITG
ncbi:nitric oxide reductase activation protein NorD [Guyparkeria halopsychrophila]|uniref:nitric oxide reductase activation protein NorD n=1 Tax=Guyparkeria halopsychrophila TaxID=3139421 RepID=UPI0037CA102F